MCGGCTAHLGTRQQPPEAVQSGQHPHLHLDGMTPEQVAEILRRQLP
jgi:hypothetical protein